MIAQKIYEYNSGLTGFTVLHYLAMCGHDKLLDKILINHPSINIDVQGIDPIVSSLYQASKFNHENCVKVLIQHGASIQKMSKRKFCNIASVSRINLVDGTDQDGNFIIDPELKYMRKQPIYHSLILSITKKIDDVFNCVFNRINEVIGSYIGLKFFLRRTLGGYEFGICFDFDFDKNKKKPKDFTCLIDQDPLLMFTITTKSVIPILSGILIIGRVYISSIASQITEWIATYPEKKYKGTY